jgi:Abscisic acid G-protein coupled receptor/The Golgi pH Regulator (GPHR) Family N-terminal
MLPSDDCDECSLGNTRKAHATSYLSHILFICTFAIAAFVAVNKILPLLAPYANDKLHDVHIPLHNFDVRAKSRSWAAASSKRIMSLVFAINIGLSAVLVVLLLCEISNLLDPLARSQSLRLCLPLLMILLVLVSPALQLQSILAAIGLNFAAPGKGRTRLAWIVETIGLGIWLFGFWYVGDVVLQVYLRPDDSLEELRTIGEGCLERIGVAGISLMACLSGFASVSAIWQTFLNHSRLITDAEINKRQAGLDATVDMLKAKESRLRALEHKMTENTSHGLINSVIGTLRTSGESKERSTLQMELKGLENMRISLQNTLYSLSARKAEQERAHSFYGRVLITLSHLFAAYCAFRLASISLSVFRRLISSTGLFQPTPSIDPVTFLLSILAKHWDPTLNRTAWTRQISFLLSGVLLLAAFNSAIQTFLLLARAFPGIAASAANFKDSTTLALLISQVLAAYVISSALMLRSNLPKDVGSVISDALGAPLEPWRVEAWFDAWFLGAAGLTALGIWAGKKIREADEDDDLGVEMGKRS